LPKNKTPSAGIKDVLSYCNACTGIPRTKKQAIIAMNNAFLYQ